MIDFRPAIRRALNQKCQFDFLKAFPVSERSWLTTKVKLIARFGEVKSASKFFRCHRNAPRLAALGKCPELAEKMKKEGVL